MAQASTDPMQPRPRGLMGKLIFLILGASLGAAGGFGGALYYSESRLSPSEEVLRLIERNAAQPEDGAPKREPRALPEAPAFATNYFEFPEDLTTNLADSTHFLQIGIGLSTQYDAQVIENVETHLMALRSDVLAVVSEFELAQVQGTDGRASLAAAIRDAINARLEALEGFGGIEDVFFPRFVLQ